MKPETTVKLTIAGFGFVIALVLFFTAIRWTHVDGSERVVWQSLGGVSDTVGEDGLHVYFGWTTTAHTYYVGTDKFIIADQADNPNTDTMDARELEFNSPDLNALTVPVMMENLSQGDFAGGKTTGPTDVKFECVMQYRLNPAALVSLHNDKTKAFRTTFVQPVLIDAIKNAATVRDARSVYQGEGRVQIQNEIETNLKSNKDFEKYGIIIEKFVLTSVTLTDSTFLEMITKEARAEQMRKTAQKEKAAYTEQAAAEQEKAKIVQNQRLVEAETKKQELIASEEANKQQRILQAEASFEKQRLDTDAEAYQITKKAEADKNRNALEGEGIKLRKVAEAEGVLKLGEAEAEALKLKLLAYEGQGGHRFASVEIAKSLGAGIQKVYYIPSNMGLNLVAEDFNGAISLLLDEKNNPITKPNSEAPKTNGK